MTLAANNEAAEAAAKLEAIDPSLPRELVGETPPSLAGESKPVKVSRALRTSAPETNGHAAAPSAEPEVGSPVIPSMEVPNVPPRAAGRPVPTKTAQVLAERDVLRVKRTNALGKQEMCGDFEVGEISAGGGDIEGFVWKFLAPKFKGGDYSVYKTNKAGQQVLVAVVPIPHETQPSGSTGPTIIQAPPGPPPATPADFMSGMSQIRTMEREARMEAAAAEEKRRSDLKALLDDMKNKGGTDAATLLILGKMLEPSKSPDIHPAVEQAINNIQEQLRQLQIPSLPPPPMDPPKPTTSPAEIANAVTSGLNAVVSPILAMVQDAQRAREANAWTPEKMVGVATGIVGVLSSLGLVGRAPLPPGPTLADVALAGVNAKLEMITSQPEEDPLEKIANIVKLVDTLRPKESGAKDVIAVVDHAIERMPEIVNSLSGFIALREGSLAKLEDKGAGRKGPVTPPVLTQLRDTVLGIKDEQVEVRAVKIINTALPALAQLSKTGKPWHDLVEALGTAGKADDITAVRKALATIIRTAWPDKKDAKATAMYHAIDKVWTAYVKEIGKALRKEQATPKTEEAASASSTGDDITDLTGTEDGADEGAAVAGMDDAAVDIETIE